MIPWLDTTQGNLYLRRNRRLRRRGRFPRPSLPLQPFAHAGIVPFLLVADWRGSQVQPAQGFHDDSADTQAHERHQPGAVDMDFRGSTHRHSHLHASIGAESIDITSISIDPPIGTQPGDFDTGHPEFTRRKLYPAPFPGTSQAVMIRTGVVPRTHLAVHRLLRGRRPERYVTRSEWNSFVSERISRLYLLNVFSHPNAA